MVTTKKMIHNNNLKKMSWMKSVWQFVFIIASEAFNKKGQFKFDFKPIYNMIYEFFLKLFNQIQTDCSLLLIQLEFTFWGEAELNAMN